MSKSIELTVTEALGLHLEIKEKQEQLEVLKAKIRAHAGKRSDGEKVSLECAAGFADVVFVSDRSALRKGANPLALTESLGEATWKHLFAVKVVLGENFDAALALLPKSARDLVKPLVEMKSSEPRVAFREKT